MFVQHTAHKIRNGYESKSLRKSQEDKRYALSVSGLDKVEVRVAGAGIMRTDNLKVFADSVGHFRVFLTSYRQKKLRQNFTFYVEDVKTKIKKQKDSIFVSGAE
jgi:hypothetical protein